MTKSVIFFNENDRNNTGNDFAVEGATRISESLKINTSLTEMSLSGISYCLFVCLHLLLLNKTIHSRKLDWGKRSSKDE